MTIDRINNDGNYEPSNCRFVPIKTNNRNRTFASIEPVIDFDSSIAMIEQTIDFCDLYRIGLRSGAKADYYDNEKPCFFIGQVEGLMELKQSKAKVYWKESVSERVVFSDADYWTSRNNVNANYNIFIEKSYEM